MLQGADAIAMYQEQIRFLVLAEHELCEEAAPAADQEAFNSHLNLEQINKVCPASGDRMPHLLRSRRPHCVVELVYAAVVVHACILHQGLVHSQCAPSVVAPHGSPIAHVHRMLSPLCRDNMRPVLAQALISLNGMYDAARAAGAPCAAEPEFRAYHLLTLIGTHGRYGYNAAEYQAALQARFRLLLP